MSQWLVEKAEFRTTKNGKEYLWVQGNTGEKRKPLYVWNAPQSTKPESLKHKVFDFLKEKDMGEYCSMDWKDAVLLDIKDLESEHPIHKVQLKGAIDGPTLCERAVFIAEKMGISQLWIDLIKSKQIQAVLCQYQTVCAGAKAHHPWENGLSTHVEEAITAACHLSRAYYFKDIHPEAVLLPLLWHDYGKLAEYAPETFEYQEDMMLLGHIYLGAKDLSRRMKEWAEVHSAYNDEVKKLIKHCEHGILAHHGQKEHGSPVVPATIEAYLVHVCDEISARQNMYFMAQQMEKNYFLGTSVIKW